jgi:hypothetical protein
MLGDSKLIVDRKPANQAITEAKGENQDPIVEYGGCDLHGYTVRAQAVDGGLSPKGIR